MAEPKADERREQAPQPSIAEAINSGLKTLSSLVANYTAAVQAVPKTPISEEGSANEDQCRGK